MTIDHEQRRRNIARVAIDLIAREGLAAATIRRIAAEAGFSTAAVTNYFADKEELLLWTYEVLSAEGAVRFEEKLANDVIDALLTLLPWCPTNVRRWKAYLAFWDEAARNRYLAGLLAQSTREGRSFLEKVLQLRGAATTGIAKVSSTFHALIQGMALQMLLDADAWPSERVREALEEGLEQAIAKANKLGAARV